MKISNRIKMMVVGVGVAVAGLTAAPVMAATDTCDANCVCTDKAQQTECFAKLAGEGSGHTDDLMSTLRGVLNTVFGIIGFIAVIMLVYGGIQYTISSGDAGKVKKAKDTILYGIVGLVIVLLAGAIVNFVLVNVLK